LFENIAFVVYYKNENKFSFNALVGALETVEEFRMLKIYFIKKKEVLIKVLKEIIKKYEKVILGISFFTTQLWKTSVLIRILKKKYGNNVLLIAGGPHPTGDPESTLKIGFDIVVLGEGEETLIELLYNIGNNKDYRNIKGIAYYDGNKKIQYTENRKCIDLDKYPPFPVRHGFFGAIEISRGCPYVCYFCQTPYISGSFTRYRSIDSICKYVNIMKINGHYDIRFITPNALTYGSHDGKTLNLPKLEELLIKVKSIVGPKGRIFLGTFPSEVRPEHVNRQSLALIRKYCANDNITIGAQSGSQRILDLCHREHNIQDIYKAVELSIESGLKVNLDFIFGLPYENEEDINMTIKFMNDLTSIGAKVHIHSFIPLPQTVFAFKPAFKINEYLKKSIIPLISKGLAFGDFKKQEKLAIKITNYYKNKTRK
jgi:B12-binding domain/radical SAM domain protein